MKVRIKEPVEHDGKPLEVGKLVDLPKAAAEGLVACGSAEDPEAAEKAAAQARAEAKAKENEVDTMKAKAKALDDIAAEFENLGIKSLSDLASLAAKAKAWDDVQPELEKLRAGAGKA